MDDKARILRDARTPHGFYIHKNASMRESLAIDSLLAAGRIEIRETTIDLPAWDGGGFLGTDPGGPRTIYTAHAIA